MNIKTACLTISYLICSFLSGIVPAFADTVVITYGSGKVQTITLDERMEEVKDIGFHKQSASMPETMEKNLLGKQPAPDKGAPKEPEPGTKKPGATLNWAPPIEE